MERKEFLLFFIKAVLYEIGILVVIVFVNVVVDASFVIKPQHTKMAELAIAGNIVAVPENYNERVYQVCIVNNMIKIPQTIVIGSSRGMYLGKEITGYNNIYNNCVSGGCIEDYYALLGLYQKKFNRIPQRVIIEVSPWNFYGDIPEQRWTENDAYREAACNFYKEVNNVDMFLYYDKYRENPYISLAYFRYNIKQWKELGSVVFEDEIANISSDISEQAEFPDGTIRYKAELENMSLERIKKVQECSTGALTYQNGDQMKKVDDSKIQMFENLIDYLIKNDIEVILYMAPFSESQCKYSFDQKLNMGYTMSYDYLIKYANKKGIEIRGGYDAREVGVTDKYFIDAMHIDRAGSAIVWNHEL